MISVDAAAFTYPGSPRPALDGISLDLKRGEVIALVGENGSGKTTVANLLTGLYLPTTEASSGTASTSPMPTTVYPHRAGSAGLHPLASRRPRQRPPRPAPPRSRPRHPRRSRSIRRRHRHRPAPQRPRYLPRPLLEGRTRPLRRSMAAPCHRPRLTDVWYRVGFCR
ncbi:ATP-binding cassette domain-containing protein [Streptomyces sp. NPDC059875]|uniref:ATP-binding cassette domain-containing protein n=1 Tax=unclassified Streptomyces TaxID=2593676 RepID=UPI00364C0745